MRTGIVLLLVMLVAGCGSAPNDPAVGGVTRGEAEALNDAAAMLDQNEPPPLLTNDLENAPTAPTPPEK